VTAAAPPVSPFASADDVLAALDPEQQQAARAVTGPVVVLAGAGTGKTRTLTHRAAYAVLSGAVPASSLLAVTFTARAAGEMRTRLRALGVGGVQARTFHAAARRQLAYFWPRVVGGEPPRLLDNTFGMVANAAARARLRPGTSEIRDLLSELEWAAGTLVGPDDYPAAAARAGREGPYDAAVVAQVYAAYRELKTAQGVADFDDLLLLTAGALEESAAVAEEFRARYRSFVVDEYQDVTPLQQRLLDAWLGGRDDLCVVGDAQQTIYSFTGATPDYLVRFRQRYPGATEVRLVRDYRSTPQVVALANGVIARAAAGTPKLELIASARPARRRCSPSTPTSPPRRPRSPPGAASWWPTARPRARSPCCTGSTRSRRCTSGAVGRRRPYLVRGGERFFDRQEVREALLLLRGAGRAADADAPAGLGAVVADVLRAACRGRPTPRRRAPAPP
jgi:DNA helicase-2/ATP-dependent DNA helicase PcrA